MEGRTPFDSKTGSRNKGAVGNLNESLSSAFSKLSIDKNNIAGRRKEIEEEEGNISIGDVTYSFLNSTGGDLDSFSGYNADISSNLDNTVTSIFSGVPSRRSQAFPGENTAKEHDFNNTITEDSLRTIDVSSIGLNTGFLSLNGSRFLTLATDKKSDGDNCNSPSHNENENLESTGTLTEYSSVDIFASFAPHPKPKMD